MFDLRNIMVEHYEELCELCTQEHGKTLDESKGDVGRGLENVETAAPTLTGLPRPTGIIFLNRKTSLAQRDFGLFDTGEVFLSTNPGTQLEMAGYPWGTQASGPSTLNAIVGQVVPSGQLVQGLPEV